MESPHNAQEVLPKGPATRRREGNEQRSKNDPHDGKDTEGLDNDFENGVKSYFGDGVEGQGNNLPPAQYQEQTYKNGMLPDDALGGDENNGEQSRTEDLNKPADGYNQLFLETGIDGGNCQLPASDPDGHRTSLDDLQKWPLSQVWQNSGLAGGIQTSLPQSVASSAVSWSPSNPADIPLGLSLEQLLLQPENIALPPFKKKQPNRIVFGDPGKSTSSKTKTKQSKQVDLGVPGWGFGTISKSKKKKKEKRIDAQIPPPPAPDVEAYRANVNRLAANFSHFENVANERTRHTWSPRVVLHDHIEPAQFKAPYEPWKDRISAPYYPEFYKTLRNIPDNCVQRVILVEDLTPSLIDLLGACFQIPPHVFEEHLDESGYRTTRENRHRASEWHTRSSAQGYSSITWYRPVLPLIPMTSRFRTRLVMDLKPPVRCPYDGCQQRHNVRLETTANIWRRSLELCPEPGVYHKGSATEFPVGWEERATIWTRDIDGCKFVILLLDPLPAVVVNENILGAQRPHQHRPPMLVSLLPRRDAFPPKARKKSQTKEVAQSHPVQDWIGQLPGPSALPTSLGPGNLQLPPPPVLGMSPSAQPPPPHTTESAAIPVEKDLSRTTGAKVKGQEVDFSPAALRRRATKPDMEPVSTSSGHENDGTSKVRSSKLPVGDPGQPSPPLPPVDERSVTTEGHGPFVPYHPIKARQSSSAKIGNIFTALHMRAYIKSQQVPTSTLEEFEYFLQRTSKGKETAQDPFRALFRVIHDDTHSLVDVIRISQQRIREGTMDEDLMQKRVTFWRSLLNRLNFNLAEVDQRLRAFVHFAYDSETHPFTFDQRTDLQSEKLAKETRQTLRNCIDLLDRSSNSLLAEMQIVDSRRSIAEAESVSKLTELAFVFIPLSFVASLFSMQVHELQEGVSLYVFAVVAIAFVLVAYAVRLSIRSSRLIEYKSRVLLQIRDESRIQYNQPIPTHTFLAWVGRAIGGKALKSVKSFVVVFAPLILLLAIFAALLSPIILLWLRNISKGFTAIVTVLLLLLDVVLVYPVVVTASGTFNLNPRAMVREVQKNLAMKRKRKEKEKKRRKEKAGLDPEALDVEDSDESDEDVEMSGLSDVSDMTEA